MTTDELKARLGNYKWSLLTVCIMLLLVVFGYQLARYIDAGHARTVIAQKETISILLNENDKLLTQTNQRDIALAIADEEKQIIVGELAALKNEQDRLKEQIAFYERVIAPENTQDGFLIDDIEVFEAQRDNTYQLRFVLLQERLTKAVIKGTLNISVSGFIDDKPITIGTEDDTFLASPLAYRFKYFQNENVTFSLPENMKAESIVFSTTVYQYKRRLGEYTKSVTWDEAVANNEENTQAQ